MTSLKDIPIEELARFTSNRQVVGFFMGVDTGKFGVVLKLKYEDQTTSTHFLHTQMIQHFVKATQHAVRVHRWDTKGSNDAPALVDEDWDAKSHTAEVYRAHAFPTTLVMAFSIGPNLYQGFQMPPHLAAYLEWLLTDLLKSGNLLNVAGEQSPSSARH
ncbi:MAG: hypothetical protein M9944_08070 [Rhizobiaceae bacterium]|nr:hypothetical protein [Rhizobiaceae bacterium]